MFCLLFSTPSSISGYIQKKKKKKRSTVLTLNFNINITSKKYFGRLYIYI